MCVYFNFFFIGKFLNKYDDGGRNLISLLKLFLLVINIIYMNMRDLLCEIVNNLRKKVDFYVKNVVWNDCYVVIIYEVVGFIVLIVCRFNIFCLFFIICLFGIVLKVIFIFWCMCLLLI